MYRLYLKGLGDVRGNKVGDYNLIEDVRADVRILLDNEPDGTQAYVYRQCVDEEGRGWGPIRFAEAYQVENGEIERIYTRWKGGRWPEVWSPKMAAPMPTERLRARYMLGQMGVRPKEAKRELREFEGPDWEKSRREFLERGPQTYEVPGEKSFSRREVDKVLRSILNEED